MRRISARPMLGPLSRAIPVVAIALVLSCTGRVLKSDSAGDAASDAGPSDATTSSTTTSSGGGDGCTPGGSATVFSPNAPGATGIAVDDQDVFWSTAYGIYSCSVAGCPSPFEITALHNPVPRQSPVAIDSDHVYFTTGAAADGASEVNLYRCPKSGCPGDPELVGPAGFGDTTIVVDDTSVYWTADTPSGTVAMRIGKDLTGLTTIPGADAVDVVSHGTIYWIRPPKDPYDPTSASIASCPITGCASGATTFAAKQFGPSRIAADDKNLYWTLDADYGNTSGTVVSCPLSGCVGEPTTIASGLYDPFAITVDGCGIYWTSEGSPPDSSDWRLGDVYMCEKPACAGPPTVVATGQDFASELAVNAHGIFWTTYEGGNVGYVPR